jgi:hypothetical protein
MAGLAASCCLPATLLLLLLLLLLALSLRLLLLRIITSWPASLVQNKPETAGLFRLCYRARVFSSMTPIVHEKNRFEMY